MENSAKCTKYLITRVSHISPLWYIGIIKLPLATKSTGSNCWQFGIITFHSLLNVRKSGSFWKACAFQLELCHYLGSRERWEKVTSWKIGVNFSVRFFGTLSADARKKVRATANNPSLCKVVAFCDVDIKKIGTTYLQPYTNLKV